MLNWPNAAWFGFGIVVKRPLSNRNLWDRLLESKVMDGFSEESSEED